MPDTAAELGCSDPFDPEQNLEASAKYVKQLYDMFGDWDLVLAAYNGGPGAISPGSPLPDWATDYINHVSPIWTALMYPTVQSQLNNLLNISGCAWLFSD